MDEENGAPRRRSPLSFIFGLLVVIGVIVLIVLFSNGAFSQSVKINSTNEFVTQLVNDRISTATVTPMNEYYGITGKMKKNANGRDYTVSYTFSITKDEFNGEGYVYSYDQLDDKGQVISTSPLSTSSPLSASHQLSTSLASITTLLSTSGLSTGWS